MLFVKMPLLLKQFGNKTGFNQKMMIKIYKVFLLSFIVTLFMGQAEIKSQNIKPRIIVTSDGEIDDQCSIIRFLLYANEWDIEGIITSSSQYHWQGHKWAGDDWIEPDLDAYEKVYPNLLKHEPGYPTPEYLRSITLLGNVKAKGEMEEVTAGSQLIVDVLLDEADDRSCLDPGMGRRKYDCPCPENHPRRTP